MPQLVSLAIGRKGLDLQVPDGVTSSLTCPPLDPTEPLRLQEQRDILSEALKTPHDVAPLAKLVEGKRRVCVVVGDLSHPSPYSVALPALTKALIDAGIRPSRISVLVCPGDCGTLLGRSAIRRYGEEIAGDFELRPWQSPDALKPEADAGYANADIRIALQPSGLPALPLPGKLDFILEFTLGKRARIDIVAAKAYAQIGNLPTMRVRQPVKSDVLLTTGGGDDWEASLEEALLSLYGERLSPTTVLGFAGGDGLGSALFGRNIQETILAFERGTLKPEPAQQYHPLRAFEQALLNTEQLVLFSEAFVNHPDGDDLLEWLDGCPKAAQKLLICDTPADMWETLTQLRGPTYSLTINPLGWRAAL